MVMEVLKISANPGVAGFLNRYEIWYDYQVFHNKKTDPKRVINDVSGIPCFHYTELSKINACSSKLIAIDNLTESIHSKKYFEKYKTDKHYLIFSGGYWPKELLKVDYNYDIIFDKQYRFDYPKKYNWISTIGNVRPQRTKLVNKLKTKDLSKSILRYSGQDIGVKDHGLDIIEFKPGEFDPYIPVIEKYYYTVSQTFPMSLYNSSYFNLIVETDLDLPGSIFLTEKTVKSLITGQPFVLMANAGLLKHLHTLGFKTYNDLWDESYDNELDFDQRLNMIVNLTSQLEQFNWQHHKSQLEYIALHNRSNFMHLDTRMNYEFTQLEKIVENL
jgi:hypothetical protein